MVKPNEIELLDDLGKQYVEALIAHIDRHLKESKGTIDQPMHPKWEGLLSEGHQATFGSRTWPEVARRYQDAGWSVRVERRNGLPTLLIRHPRLVQPIDGWTEAGPTDDTPAASS